MLRVLRLVSADTGCTVLYLAARGYLFFAYRILGIELRVVGQVPQQRVVVACNHQSMIDAVVILACLPNTVMIFRRSLLWATGLPWLFVAAGMIPVYDCGFGLLEVLCVAYGQAELAWLQRVHKSDTSKNICIFPEGQRVAPQNARDAKYHSGVVVIARSLQLPIAPAVIDSGIVWGREFLPRLQSCDTTVTLRFLPTQACNAELSVVERMIKEQLQTD